EEADRDVTLVALNVELVRQCLALVWQLPAHRARDELGRGFSSHFAGSLFPGRIQWLRPLAAVAIDRNRLGAQLPGLNVGLLDFFDRGFLRHVDRLADRAGDERLRG